MNQISFGAEITLKGTRFSLWAPLAQKAEAMILAEDDSVLWLAELQPVGKGWFSGLDSGLHRTV